MNAEYEKEIGAKIRNYREKRKMTQEFLSTKLQLEGCDITRSAFGKNTGNFVRATNHSSA